MSQKKDRLDMRLVQDEFFPSREKARAAIMAGLIYIDGQRADKAGQPVNAAAKVEVRGNPLTYVSRGGLKLEKAIKVFGLVLNGRVVLDAGASTGGFTDCALRHGARLVFAVDVGYGQLAWNLRTDPRVVVMERVNIRHLSPGTLDEIPDFVTIDLSFISLSKVLPLVGELTAPEAEGVALVKPQFEAGREKVGKKGVVRDQQVHIEVLNNNIDLVTGLGWAATGLDFSPIKGPEGNIEYLLYFKKIGDKADLPVETVVRQAHQELN